MDQMNDHTAIAAAEKIAAEVVAPAASRHDKEASFPREAIDALAAAGLLGAFLPAAAGGAGLGPRTLAAVLSVLSQADASVGMVYLMHVCATQVIASSKSAKAIEAARAIAANEHLSTLAFSEKGSRSHFWAPVSKAARTPGGVQLSALKSWVTSAGQADSYVVATLSPDAKGPTDSMLYLVAKDTPGVTIAGAWDGLGLRANASAPMTLEAVHLDDGARLTGDGAGFKAMLEIVLPWFNLGSASVSLGIARAAVASTTAHLKGATFEHMNRVSLGEALPNLRALLASMQVCTDGLAARIADTCSHLESPGELTMLRVLEVKCAAGETALRVTGDAMHACGGAAFSRHTSVERFFRDAHAGAVMAPTVDVLRDFIGKALLGIPLF
jgi:alkylation response protein AidB-like acyl-CoA dehydrogenase